MERAALVWMLGLTIVITGGCVTKEKYDTLVDELNKVKRDLNVTKADEMALTQQAKTLESLNRETKIDADMAATALQRSKDEAEAEKRLAEERLAKLQRTVNYLVLQQRALRQSVEEGKEDNVALQAMLESYEKRMNRGFGSSEALGSPQIALAPEPASPGLAPPAPAGSTPASTAAQPQQPSVPPPDKQPPPRTRRAEPAEEGMLSTIKGWLVSIWRSIFS